MPGAGTNSPGRRNPSPLESEMSSSPAKSTFLIACGGTGGHLFPGIAIGEKLLEWEHEVIFLISRKEIDRLATERYGHLRFEEVPSRIMPKPWSPRMPEFLRVSLQGVRKCRRLIGEHDVAAVLGMGGFTSTAPLLAARSMGVPGVVHEANAIPGRANRLNARLAKRVLVGWEACRRHFPADKVEVTGTPVRPELYELPEASDARVAIGLQPDLFTVMVMGGSQGAQGINDVVTAMLTKLDSKELQFIHLTGVGSGERVRNAYASAAVRAHVMEFSSEMELVYAASDFGICRSGASSLTEMSVVGLPGLLIPYPHAADDHQMRNAEVFSEAGACLVRRQDELTSSDLAGILHELATDRARVQSMANAIRSLAPERCVERIGELLTSL